MVYNAVSMLTSLIIEPDTVSACKSNKCVWVDHIVDTSRDPCWGEWCWALCICLGPCAPLTSVHDVPWVLLTWIHPGYLTLSLI